MQALLPSYRFLSLLGRGGMGAVFKAIQISLNRPVAIKVLPADLMEDADSNFAARFRQEALTMAKLNHPGIVSVFESGQAKGLLYIVMEFVDGTDVARMIQSGGKISPEFTTTILTQVCDALQYAHQRGVIHRDLKPANLLVTRDRQVKVADFGLAKHHDDAMPGLTKTNLAIGTPDFVAPEALTANTPPLDARADLYSLGVTLYQMLTGEIPRGLWEMPSVRVGSDPRFDAIIEKAMQPKREARYQSSTELRRDLNEIHTQQSQAGPETESGVFSPSSTVRRRTLVGLLVVQIAIILALIAFWPRISPRKISRKDIAVAPAVPAANIRDAARWLVQERANFKVVSNGREFEVKSEQDIPEGDFQIVYLWFDRWLNGPPQPPPPAAEFEVLRAVKTLRYVWLRLPKLHESAYAFLADNANLQTLTLEGSDSTDDTLVTLGGLKHLESVSISDAHRLTGHKLAGSAWLPRVQHLDLLNSAIDDEAAAAMTNCTRLTHLRVTGTAITYEGLRNIVSLRRLTELLAGNCRNINEQDFVEVLPQFYHLKRLEVEDAPYEDDFAAAIANALTNLTELRLAGTKLTDAGLVKLGTLPQLKALRVIRTQVTSEGLAVFEKAHPQCQIER